MHHYTGPQSGYTRWGIAFIILFVAFASLLALTKYFELTGITEGAMEEGLIASVRQGIESHADEARHRRSSTLYPKVLDDAEIGDATLRNRFFEYVLNRSVAVAGWSKIGKNSYRTPSGIDFSYNPDTGDFTPDSDQQRKAR